MKGLLYVNFLLNKVWFIASGILAVLGVAVSAALRGAFPESSLGADMLFIFEIVVLATCNEWLGRNFESNLKTRFADYALAGGISKAQFVTAEMLKNLISAGIAFLMCAVIQFVFCVFDRSFFSVNNLTTLLALTLLFGAVEWMCMPVIVSLKSAEKAAIVVGLVLGFGVMVPLMIVFNYFDWDEQRTLVGRLIDFFEEPMSFVSVIAISAAIYVIFYIVLLDRVRKGDVC